METDMIHFLTEASQVTPEVENEESKNIKENILNFARTEFIAAEI